MSFFMFSVYFSFLLQLFFNCSLFALENKHVWLLRLTVIILCCQKILCRWYLQHKLFMEKLFFRTDRPKKNWKIYLKHEYFFSRPKWHQEVFCFRYVSIGCWITGPQRWTRSRCRSILIWTTQQDVSKV